MDMEVLKAISDLMDEKLEKQKQELKKEISHEMQVLFDTQFASNFNLLAEGQEEILRRMPNPEDAEIVNGRLDVLEAVVKRLSREVNALKKAN